MNWRQIVVAASALGAGLCRQFENSGRRNGATVVILQRQDGEPRIVYPIESAVAKAKWPRS